MRNVQADLALVYTWAFSELPSREIILLNFYYWLVTFISIHGSPILKVIFKMKHSGDICIRYSTHPAYINLNRYRKYCFLYEGLRMIKCFTLGWLKILDRYRFSFRCMCTLKRLILKEKCNLLRTGFLKFKFNNVTTEVM